MLEENATAANLLYSAHLREPPGARTAMDGGACKGVLRQLREARGVMQHAAREALRTMLPNNAEAKVLVEAAFAGELGQRAGRKWSVQELAKPRTPASWMGASPSVGGATHKTTGAEGEVTALITLMTVWDALKFAVHALHPLDKTVYATFAIVKAEICTGLQANGVAAAVESVLAPFLREYEDGFDAFQKSESSQMPVLADVWTKVKAFPSVTSYITQAAAASLAKRSGGGSEGGGGGGGEPTKKQIASAVADAVAKAVKAAKRELSPGRVRREEGTADDAEYEVELGDKPDGAGASWEANRRKRIVRAFKAGQEWAKALVKTK